MIFKIRHLKRLSLAISLSLFILFVYRGHLLASNSNPFLFLPYTRGISALKGDERHGSGMLLASSGGEGSGGDFFEQFLTVGGKKKPSFSGVAYSRLNVDLRENNPYEEFVELRNRGLFKVELGVGDNSRLFLSAFMEYNFFQNDDRRYLYDARLFEAYLDLTFEDYDLRIGRQNVTWGNTDIALMDNVNPKNFEEMFFTETEFFKIPVFMVQGKYYFMNNEIEGVWIPFYEPLRFAPMGTDWSLISGERYAEFQAILLEQLPLEEGDLEGIELNVGTTDFPDSNPINSEFGLKLSMTYRGYDFSFSYLYVWEDLALFIFDPDLIKYMGASTEGIPTNAAEILNSISIVEGVGFYPLYTVRAYRQHIVGADAVTTTGSLGLQAGGILLANQHIYDTQLNTLDKPILLYSLGGDYNLPHNILINLALLQMTILDYDPSIFIDEVMTMAGGGIRTTFLHDDLEVHGGGLFNYNDRDYVIIVGADYKLRAGLDISGGINILQGKEDTFFGMFTANDNVFIRLKYSF